MNNFLNEILEHYYKKEKVNTFDSSFSGSVKIAENYLSKLDKGSYNLISSQKIEMFYDNKLIGVLNGQCPSSSSPEANRISKSKSDTEEHLAKFNLKTTNSKIFEAHQYEIAKEFIIESENLKVIKPNSLNGGKGITLNVSSSNFKYAWNHALNSFKVNKKTNKILIQDFIEGVESRFNVIEGEFYSAILRIPPHVIGDGISNIATLIDEKNKIKKGNPHLRMLPIKIDDDIIYLLSRSSYNLESVPQKDELVTLRETSNISSGGDTYEISHLVGDELKLLAERAVNSIPGLRTAGVDIIYKSFNDNNGTVIEVNYDGNLRMHHYPFKGTPKKSVHKLIDKLISNID